MRWNCPTCGGLVKREIHPDGLMMAKSCAEKGKCIFCEEPLSGGQRVICGNRECRGAYMAAYHRDRRFAKIAGGKIGKAAAA